jgi:FkbM family methyltransferase
MLKHIVRGVVIWILRLMPLKSGVTVVAAYPLVRWLLRDLSDPAMTTLRDGTPIAVSPHDHDGRILYLFGTNDPKVASTTTSLLKPGDVFLDIGANHATIGFAAAHYVGTSGAVHLFEPQRKLGDRIAAAIEAGAFGNVTLHRIGLLDVDGTFELRSPHDHSGMATFAGSAQQSYLDSSETCTVRAIAPYVAPLVDGRHFAAKIDIEGAEPKIMPWLLTQPNMRFLIFEASNNAQELYDDVRTAGLLLYGLVRHPFLMRYHRIDGMADLALFHDVIAVNAPGPGPRATNRNGLAVLLRRGRL